VDRRGFLRLTATAGVIAALDAVAAACGDDRPTASTRSTTTDAGRVVTSTTGSTTTTAAPVTTEGTATTDVPEVTRYGPLSDVPDDNGLLLPAGFSSELLAVGGETVPGTDHRWHPFPDGGACFALDDGGWVYVNNSEVWVEGAGGAGALRFDADGRVVDAYRVLDGTTMNCAGGATPWGTWLSCEETTTGQVWECDPLGREPGVPRPAMGMFRHEMVAADAGRRVLYLTEDEPDGLLYRFRPRIWGDLSDGELHALAVDSEDGSTRWVPVRGLGEPGRSRTRYDAPGATALPGGEGVALDGDILYLSTKGDDRISRLDLHESRMTLYWEGPPLAGPDNLLVQSGTGNLFVCEDGDDMELVMLTPDGHADPFLRFVGHDGSEVTGAAFDPTGTRLIVNSQRAPTPTMFGQLFPGEPSWPLGRTYMITGPF
jgi:hypothetical protein